MKDNQTQENALVINGTIIAPGVAETIISLAAAEAEGVAGVGQAGALSTIMATFNAGKAIPTGGVELHRDDNGKVTVAITVQVYYGYRIVEVAAKVREAVFDALKGQIGVEVAAVDIYVDGLVFKE